MKSPPEEHREAMIVIEFKCFYFFDPFLFLIFFEVLFCMLNTPVFFTFIFKFNEQSFSKFEIFEEIPNPNLL